MTKKIPISYNLWGFWYELQDQRYILWIDPRQSWSEIIPSWDQALQCPGLINAYYCQVADDKMSRSLRMAISWFNRTLNNPIYKLDYWRAVKHGYRFAYGWQELMIYLEVPSYSLNGSALHYNQHLINLHLPASTADQEIILSTDDDWQAIVLNGQLALDMIVESQLCRQICDELLRAVNLSRLIKLSDYQLFTGLNISNLEELAWYNQTAYRLGLNLNTNKLLPCNQKMPGVKTNATLYALINEYPNLWANLVYYQLAPQGQQHLLELKLLLQQWSCPLNGIYSLISTPDIGQIQLTRDHLWLYHYFPEYRITISRFLSQMMDLTCGICYIGRKIMGDNVHILGLLPNSQSNKDMFRFNHQSKSNHTYLIDTETNLWAILYLPDEELQQITGLSKASYLIWQTLRISCGRWTDQQLVGLAPYSNNWQVQYQAGEWHCLDRHSELISWRCTLLAIFVLDKLKNDFKDQQTILLQITEDQEQLWTACQQLANNNNLQLPRYSSSATSELLINGDIITLPDTKIDPINTIWYWKRSHHYALDNY